MDDDSLNGKRRYVVSSITWNRDGYFGMDRETEKEMEEPGWKERKKRGAKKKKMKNETGNGVSPDIAHSGINLIIRLSCKLVLRGNVPVQVDSDKYILPIQWLASLEIKAAVNS